MENVVVALDASSVIEGGGLTYLQQILPRIMQRSNIHIGAALMRRSTCDYFLDILPQGALITANSRASSLSRQWTGRLKEVNPGVIWVPTEISFKRYKVPTVVSLRNALALEPSLAFEHGRWARMRLYLQRLLAVRSIRAASLALAVSESAAEQCRISLRDPPPLRVVHHGGPEERRPKKRASARRFLFVSNLMPHKNLHRVIRALALVETPGWTFDIVGRATDVNYATALRELTRDLELECKIAFHGAVSHERVWTFYEQADCLVWPSYAETFGHPLVEAHALGLQLLVSDTPATRGIVGEAATYFDPFSPNSIATSIEHAMHGFWPICETFPLTFSWNVCADLTATALREAALT
jgi:glycosyltransferase involved in cell wall biosynthesis